MKKIKIFDTTLRDGEQSPGCTMTKEEKVFIAKKLNDMKVDIIEAGFAASNERDFGAIKEISRICDYSTVCSLARLNKNDIDIAYDAIKDAKNKRIHVFIATSDIHMKYKLNKDKEEVKRIVKEMVSYAKSKCSDIEFSLEDATRTDKDFACEIINIAIDSGATTINIPDTVGYTTPFEFVEFIDYIVKNSNIKNVDMSVHCHNDLGMATANSFNAIMYGANQIECTINGIGERAGNTALEEVVATIDLKKDKYNITTSIDTSMIYEISNIVSSITNSSVQNNKPIVGENAFKHESGIHQAGVLKNRETYEILDPNKFGIFNDNIVIGIHSGKAAVKHKINSLGYNFDDEYIVEITKLIKEWIAANNKDIEDNDIITIINNSKRLIKRYS